VANLFLKILGKNGTSKSGTGNNSTGKNGTNVKVGKDGALVSNFPKPQTQISKPKILIPNAQPHPRT